MQKGYWMVRVDIANEEQFMAYKVANAAAFEKFGARFLARAGRFEVPEGTTRSRNTIVEFPSYQAALDCWHSPEYQAALALRRAASTVDLVIVEGCDASRTC